MGARRPDQRAVYRRDFGREASRKANSLAATAKPLPKAVKSAAAPTAKAAPLPAAAEAPAAAGRHPPGTSLGGQDKHHGQLNVDKFNIETTPGHGLAAQDEERSAEPEESRAEEGHRHSLERRSAAARLFGLPVFIWAAANGMLSGPAKKPEQPPAAATATAPPASSGETKPEPEKKPAPKPVQATWPTNFKTVFVENASVGDFQLTVLKPIRGAPPKGLKTKDSKVLIVPVNVQPKEGAKKGAEFVGWDDVKIKDDVLLRDDKDGKDVPFVFLGQAFREGEDAKAAAKQRIQVHLVFELPEPLPKAMYLALPVAAFHAEGPSIGYKFGPDEIVSETPKQEP